MKKNEESIKNYANNNLVNVEALIDEKFETLSKGEKKIARYIQENYAQAVLLSSTELAAMCDVSDTTVVRFAKDLGFKGFADFKKQMRKNINTYHSPYHLLQNMVNESSNCDLEKKYLETLIRDVQDFALSIDTDKINQAANLILNARTIYCIGIGTDSIMMSFMAIYLRKIGLDVVCITEGGISLWDCLLRISDQDVMILSSFPRYLKDEQRVGKLANEKNTPLITITSSSANNLLWHSDINFSVRESQKTYFNSMTLPSIVCNLILLKIYEKDPKMVSKNMQYYLDFSKPDWL